MGRDGKSHIATLVERTSRFVMLVPLPHSRQAHVVRKALARKIRRLPQALRRSLTWDQGREMAEHARLAIDANIEVYFCDPHSPWQRGSNENTNGLLRQYLPKNADLSVHTTATLNRIADELNGRPRETLGWKTPADYFAQFVATAA
jgi:IS30 family transposase